jgi:hypothetical protein
MIAATASLLEGRIDGYVLIGCCHGYGYQAGNVFVR